MLGLGKKENNNFSKDATLVDQSKKITLGVAILILAIIIILGLEVYTSSKLSSQKNSISMGENSKNQSNEIMLRLGAIGSQSKQAEYKYLKYLSNVMSPTDFQNFKNSISGIATKNNVMINFLTEGKPVNLKTYQINSVNYEAISKYTNYINFKKDISNIEFKFNFEEEAIVRENPSSSNIKINGIISAIVFDKKEEVFTKKKNFFNKMKLAEEKKLLIKMDTNKDGKVSEEEKKAYQIKNGKKR
jgi:Tfp pilus assembly protein PilO|tara:strand:- start:1542 stop:2276 length:735 start_codon:yes stop_codon:yes gene_type:complete